MFSKLSLKEFLDEYMPSLVSSTECDWIQINIASDNHENVIEIGDPEEMVREFAKRPVSKHSPESVMELARRHNVMSGKWMIFCSYGSVDSVWTKLANAVIAKQLGPSIKVNPCGDGSNALICVYTRDCSDYDDLLRVRKQLKQLGFAGRLSYKPDAYTYLGIDSKNKEWTRKHRASIYTL